MSETTADLIIVGGRVLTMGDGPRGAEAVAVRDGRIVAVGTARELRSWHGPATQLIEHPGATVLPGINDSHAHIATWGAAQPPLAIDCTPRAVGSIAEIVAAVAEQVRTAPHDSWIRGQGWALGALAECAADPSRRLTRHDLDAVAPHHPVVLHDFSVHAIWCNTRALELAGVSAATPTPTGGDIEREADGTPSGVLAEFAAQSLVERHMPPRTRAERATAIELATERLHRLGITSVTDPALGPAGGEGMLGTETLHAYEELAADGRLRLRVQALLLFGGEGTATASAMAEGLETLHVRTPDERLLREAGVKLFGDGIPPLRTAWLHEPYEGTDHRGSLVVPGADDEERVAELTAMIRLAHAAGRQVAVHATGDATVDATVAAMAAAQAEHPGRGLRHYVIHADLASPQTLRTMAAEGIGMNVQPRLKAEAGEAMVPLLGDRTIRQWPCRSALDTGVTLAMSSDAPVTWPDWREGVAAAVLREFLGTGEVSGPEERVTVEEALHAYTAGGARQDRAESWKGALLPGYAADVCVVAGDLTTADPHALTDHDVLATVFDGAVVHAA
jgi:predicted amidohydrolase YtcJ